MFHPVSDLREEGAAAQTKVRLGQQRVQSLQWAQSGVLEERRHQEAESGPF